MSTITEVRVSADDFELGRLFEAGTGPDTVMKLETLVPVGDDTVPYFRVRTDRLQSLLEAVREGSIVDGLRVVDDYGEESLLALDWEAKRDRLFGGFREPDVAVLSAHGRSGIWTLEHRFEDAEALEAFREHCDRVGLDPEVIRVYNPTSPGSDLSYGVTEPQREAFVLAVGVLRRPAAVYDGRTRRGAGCLRPGGQRAAPSRHRHARRANARFRHRRVAANAGGVTRRDPCGACFVDP